jgi:hypothetical protein
MDARTKPLDAIQRRLSRLIRAPEGVASELAESGDADARALRALLRGDGRLGATERLEIYANAYFLRLHDVLRDDFGALHAAMGDDWFHDLVTAYLPVHPPRQPSIRFAGDRLASFLADATQALPFRRRFPWAADLAALEWALVDAFDAEDAEVLRHEQLASIPADRWAELRFVLQPAFQMLDLVWPVQGLRGRWDREEACDASGIEPRRERVAVWRSEERVCHRALDPLEAAALAVVRGGGSFGSLCCALSAEVGESAAPERAAGLLARWLADGLVSRFTLADEAYPASRTSDATSSSR